MSSAHPGCIIFLIDRSGSMNNQFGTSGDSCAYGAAKAVNSIVGELALRCMKGEECSPRIWMGFFGYSQDDVDWAAPKFPPVKDGLVNISKLAECDDQHFDEANEVYIPWVVEEEAYGATPMKKALTEVRAIAEQFAQNNPNSFPPIIINITDGHPTDCDMSELEQVAAPLSTVSTSDGECLVWNVHISPSEAPGELLPSSEANLPDDLSRNLFRASSLVPSSLANVAVKAHGMNIGEEARCFAYNSNSTQLTKLLTLASSVPDADEPESE